MRDITARRACLKPRAWCARKPRVHTSVQRVERRIAPSRATNRIKVRFVNTFVPPRCISVGVIVTNAIVVYSFRVRTEVPCARVVDANATPRDTDAGAARRDAADVVEQPQRAFDLEDSEDATSGTTRLRRQDFEHVARDKGLREELKSDRLSAAIRGIDSARDGVKALELAKEDPEFRAFTERLLDTLNASSAK